MVAAVMILLVAAVFRFVALREVPPGLAQDEVLDADIAMFIRGGENALFFRHGYGHEPLYHYWAAPFQALLGDNLLSVRLPAAVLGLLLVALVLRWARRDFGQLAALAAGFLVAVSWWPVIFSRIGIRPILEPVLLLAVAWFWPLGATEVTERDTVRSVLAGLVLGLTFYSYTAARVLFLLPSIYLVYLLVAWLISRHREKTRRAAFAAQARYGLIILVIALIVYAPMGITLRVEPDLQQRVDQLGGPLEALSMGDVRPVVQMTVATLGVFSFTGDPRWTYTLPGRPLFDATTSLLFYAGLAFSLWRWLTPRYAFLLIWLAVTLLPSAVTPDAPSTVRLVGAIPVVYLMPGLALEALIMRKGTGIIVSRERRWLLVATGGALGVMLLANAGRTFRDGFIRWPADPETHLKYQTILRDIAVRLQSETGGKAAPILADVFFEPIDASSLTRSLGRDPQARWVQSGEGVAGALVWPAGSKVETTVYVPEFAPLNPELQRAARMGDKPVYRSESHPSFAAYILPTAPPSLDRALKVDFEDPITDQTTLRLEAVGLPTTERREGAPLVMLTLWEVQSSLPADLALFVHMVDDAGNIVAQSDGFDTAATLLQAGDRVLQRHVLPLSSELAPASFQIVVGLYGRANGRRWLQNGEDRLKVATCEVSAATDSLHCRLAG